MNFDKDYSGFKEVWTNAHAVMAGGNKTLSELAIESVFDDLEDYTLDLIRQCVKKHRKTMQFAPTPFDIISMINDLKGNKHIGVEEAWALAQGLFDENATVVITNEIMTAWGVAECVYPDKVGARMAFKEKYLEIIKTAPEPKWWATQGDSREQRVAAISNAVDLGRLTHDRASQLCLGYDKPVSTVAGLIESAAKKSNVIDAKSRWAGLSDSLKIPSIEKSKLQLAKEHGELVKKVSLEACEKLRRENPQAFAKSSVELIEQHDMELSNA